MILLLAGLQGIPQRARGGGRDRRRDARGRRFRYVTLPLLGPTIRVSVFLSIIGALQLFDLVWVTTRGGPVNASNTMATYMFDRGFRALPVRLRQRRVVVIFVRSRSSSRSPTSASSCGATSKGPRSRMADDDRRDAAAARPSGSPARATASADAARLRYVVARSCSRVIVIPVAYAVLGGFRDATSSSSSRPGRPARPVGLRPTTPTIAHARRSFWRQVWQQHRRSPLLTTASSSCRRRRSRRSCSPATRSAGREVVYSAVHARAAVPGRGRDPAAVHPRPRQVGLLDNPLGVALPAGGVRGCPLTIIILRPFFRSIPKELAGRRRDRRLRPVRASSGRSCCRCRGRC